MQHPDARFAAPDTRALRRLGIRGQATVRLDGATLVISGAAGGVVTVPAAMVRRLRAGWEETKHGPHHEARLWRAGEAKPLTLHLIGRDPSHYAAVIRGFAAEVAAAGGIARLETGTTPAAALFLPVAFGILSLAAIGIAAFALENEPWWGRVIVPLVPLGVFAVGLRIARRLWPKPAPDLAAFNRAVAR